MLIKRNPPLFILLTILLNVGIYITALLTETDDRIFAECARNSGRTSAAINLILLLFIGRCGLKSIFQEKSKLQWFRLAVTLFTVNHLIHFFFVYQNFNWHEMELSVFENLHGFITFISVIALPILVYSIRRLSKGLYYLLILYFFNVTYFIGISFYARYKPGIDEAYLHRAGVLVMIFALLYVLYRVIIEATKEWKVEK